jgi:MFS family permease
MNPPSSLASSRRVFIGCFIALMTCAFGFLVRTQVIGEWQVQFNLSETEKGDILGVGFWPFALSIFLVSLVIDKVGYGRAALFGFILHLSSTILLLTAHSAQMLYWGTFLFALSNGTVEAYISPAVVAMYPHDRIKWLNILHAAWPGGIMIAGLLAISLGNIDWRWKIGLTLIPALTYGALLLGSKFPVSERVSAGVSYREMLQDFGALGTFVAVYLISLQICQGILKIEDNTFLWPLLPALVGAVAFGIFVRSLGRGIYFILLLIMIPLATTELGVDSWISDLMGPEMQRMSLNAGWVLVYMAGIMTVLRCLAGGFVHRFSALGVLAIGSTLAMIGLLTFSHAAGIVILAAATIYGVGKAFFWPTMLGIASEQCPKGGAVILNCIGGVGMLGLSVGMVFLGNVQDRSIDHQLAVYDETSHTQLHSAYLTDEKESIFGSYLALDQTKLQTAPDADKLAITQVQGLAKKHALQTAALFPLIMLLSYAGLILYFRSRGGYRIQQLHPSAEDLSLEASEY